ncbi:hypothetical protein WJX84_009360 [Apatococcus fuscideae]|uniref:Uncharacterized protein n=1 Tax=Apatococcus fuscideae TaxID=2026836 RepID=A0AAW1SXS0_9CHLO
MTVSTSVQSATEHQEFNGLNSAVSYSSQMVAAYRAIENGEEDGLFTDPLAEGLAGPAAMQDARTQSPEWKHDAGLPGQKRRKAQYSRMACRTKFIDDCIQQFLHGQPGQKQVVLLGAGMDSRAWRMDVPSGVAWFEVDMADVLLAKQRTLSSLGAQVPAPAGPPDKVTPAASKASSDQHYKHPLRSSSWVSLQADLEGASWQEELKRHGFRANIPTIWVLEGLLMYLGPKAVDSLLSGTSGLSSQGSMLVTMAFNEGALGRDDLTVGDYAKTPAWQTLKSTFKSGVPDQPQQWLQTRGWQAQQVLTYGEVAHLAAGKYGQFAFDTSTTGLAGRRTLFITASPTST